MVWFKSCPKCGTGDLLEEKDHYGAYVQCVQCGYMKDAPSVHAVVPQPVAPEAESVRERSWPA